jgi:hypothetical protein
MTSTIITKNSSTAGAVPLAANLTQGELAINTTDRRLYTKDATGTVVEVGSGTAIVYRENFSGNDVTTVFTMAHTPVNEDLVDIYINGIYQNKDTFSISTNVITFTEAPVSGTDNIEVMIWQSAPIGSTDANYVSYTPAGTGAVATTVQTKLRETVSVKDFGAVGDGVTDDTAALISALNSLSDGQTLDLNGLHLNIFVGVAGVTSGDAIALSGVPRLFNKNNITIKNGKITADSPSVSGTKYRYPSTLTIDGCTNITLENLILHSKGESWGDTDASSGLSDEDRRAFVAQNGGHALAVIRSLNTKIIGCQTRLCGSVGSAYVISSHDTHFTDCFSNPGSLGYAAYAFDSWCGDASVSGYPAHVSTLTDCSASKEGYTYGSKGCVVTEDKDVTVTVNGGYYADAYPNGSARDIGYAFGCSSSQTIVNGAVVENCAAIGYTGTTNNTDYTYLYVSNIHARGLRKTVHQTEATSVGRMYWKYVNVDAEVVGGSTWPGDGNLSREETSYLAMPNSAIRVGGSFVQCSFRGATYGFISTVSCFGQLKFSLCDIETNGFLWDSKNIGSSSAGAKLNRGILFDRCAIDDISAEVGAYTTTISSVIYTFIDLSTSTIHLASGRLIESSTITTPATFIERYAFPRDDANVETLSVTKTLYVDSAKVQSINNNAGASRGIRLPRPDKYKFMEFKIFNSAASTGDLRVEDYLGATILTLTAGQAALAWNDGAADFVRIL